MQNDATLAMFRYFVAANGEDILDANFFKDEGRFPYRVTSTSKTAAFGWHFWCTCHPGDILHHQRSCVPCTGSDRLITVTVFSEILFKTGRVTLYNASTFQCINCRIHLYSKTTQMHNISNLFNFGYTLCIFYVYWTVHHLDNWRIKSK